LNLRTLLRLGRTSNLPTVWSNVLAGTVLSGVAFDARGLCFLMLCGSMFYAGGMFLNDAFDAEVDALERPGRPIPAGEASRLTVFSIGYGLLTLGLVLLAAIPMLGWARPGPFGFAAGLATCFAVLAYNRWHKDHAWSPVVMGACRAGLYATAALTVSGKLGHEVLLGASALWLYIVGLTHVARFETGSVVARAWVAFFVLSPLIVAAPQVVERRAPLPALCFALLLGWTVRCMAMALRGGRGQIPRAVMSLIAGASLVDALFIALWSGPALVLAALATFLLTLKWQSRIPGT
jgi:UbiA prenyltransferase family